MIPTTNYGAVTFDGDGVLAVDGEGAAVILASTTVQAGVRAGMEADGLNGPDVTTGAITLGDGGSLVTSGANAVNLGLVTLSGPEGGIGTSAAADLTFSSYAGGAGKTLNILGGGRTVLALGATDAVGTTFAISEDSTLVATGVAPLSGANGLQLGGGTFELTGGASMSGVAVSVVEVPE
ncbi:MAG: hypothetical protein GY953_29935, partial [bacterium]|nr:hypothetical protein [bacterium]